VTVFLELLAAIAGVVGLLFGAVALVRARAIGHATSDALARVADAQAVAADAQARAADAQARAADAQGRSVDAQARATEAQSRAAEAQTRALDAASRSAAAELAATTGHGASANDRLIASQDESQWVCEWIKGNRWAMRNAGTRVVHSALLTDATRPPKFVIPDEVIPRDVAPRDHLLFRTITERDAPPPRVRVAWTEDGSGVQRAQEQTLIL
jgi:hypothetical protein